MSHDMKCDVKNWKTNKKSDQIMMMAMNVWGCDVNLMNDLNLLWKNARGGSFNLKISYLINFITNYFFISIFH